MALSTSLTPGSSPSRLGGLLLSLTLLAGCSGPGSSSPSGSSLSTPSGSSSTGLAFTDLAHTTEPASGEVDSIRWNLVREPIGLDPMTTQTEAEGPVVGNMCEGLVRLSADLAVEPALASSYEQVSPTGWRFRLRQGVTFWNGSALRAEDVVASLTRSFTSETSYWTGYFGAVKSVTAVDDETVEISLSRPDALLLEELTTAGGAISSKQALDKAGDKYGTPDVGVQCTGPFSLAQWKAGDSLTLVRNKGYWDSTAMPKVGSVVFSWIADEATLTQSLAAGQVDGTFAVPFSGVSSLRASQAGTLTLGATSLQLMLIPTERRGPLADASVRNAIFQAIDRRGIATQLLSGAALPGSSFVAPYFTKGSEALSAAYSSLPTGNDAAKARELLGGKAVTITVATPGGESYTRVANAMAQMLKQVGVTMTIEVLTSAENEALFFDKALREKYDGFLSLPFTNVPNPLEQLLYVTPGHVYNYGLYDNADFAKAFAAAMAEQDAAKRTELTLAAQQIAQRDLPWIPVVVEPVRLWQSSRISGSPASFAYLYSAWAAHIGGRS